MICKICETEGAEPTHELGETGAHFHIACLEMLISKDRLTMFIHRLGALENRVEGTERAIAVNGTNLSDQFHRIGALEARQADG